MGKRITAEQLNKMTTAQLKAYINRTAKKANRDLRALEAAGAAGGSRAYQYLEAVAFDKKKGRTTAVKNEKTGETERKPIQSRENIVGTNKKGEIYFKTNFTGKESRGQLLSRAAMIAGFKGAKTNTVRGVEKAYEKTYNTYVNKRAREIAKERASKEGRRYTRADILSAKRDIQSMADKDFFNSQWGALSKEQYEIAKRQSGETAKFFASGYTADELMEAINKLGEEQTLAEYVDFVRSELRGEDITQEEEEEERNPFLNV